MDTTCGYKCECVGNCGKIFDNKSYEDGSEQVKNSEDWIVVHPECPNKLNMFPIFYHSLFTICNVNRTPEWLWAHPVELTVV
jgi:hypothetical protein